MSLSFRWLGVAGVELQAGNQVLAIDPFFSRPSLIGLFRPILSDADLTAKKLPICNYVLVTHSHWDHLMDVHEVVRHTHAQAYGSENTCQILRLQGIADAQINEIHVGNKLSLGAFKVEVIEGRHSRIPFGRVFNGNLRPGLLPPLRMQDYRMDICLGFYITVMGMRVLLCAAQPRPAEVLFTGAQESRRYYQSLFIGVQPHTVIPIHWDNFVRPLNKPLRRLIRPGGMPLFQLTMLARDELPYAQVIIPEIFRRYALEM